MKVHIYSSTHLSERAPSVTKNSVGGVNVRIIPSLYNLRKICLKY